MCVIGFNLKQRYKRCTTLSVLFLCLAFNPGANALTININPGVTLAGNAAALDAFDRAALLWSNQLADPFTMTIDANLVPIANPNVIGQASSVTLVGSHDLIVNAMKADSLAEPDDGIVASLPSAAQFSAILPLGFGLTGSVGGTKANLKALGFAGLDADFGLTDATIEFNTNFAFDFDNSDGVGVGLIDFETVAAHEIGHALGFISIVDSIDFFLNQGISPNISPRTLDMFRFGDGTADDPATTTDFTNNARNLVPGDAAIFDDLANEFSFSTGSFNGDGRQASHWKDNGLTGTLIGIMDPTLASGAIVPITNADLRALDLIGYDITTVPVPAAFWLFGTAMIVLLGSAKRRRTTGF